MSDYTKTTDFAIKDSLLSGNPLKVITGTAHDNEYNAIATAITSKADKASTLAQFAATTSAQLAGVISDETGTGLLVFATSPTLTTPNIGTPSAGTLTNCTGLPLSGVTDSTTEALGVGSLEVGHASDTTISRASAGVIAVEGINVLTTATGAALAGNSGQAFSCSTLTAATSVNKVAITSPATGSTLTIADGKTLTASNTLSLAGTDSTTMTFPPASASVGYINIPQNSQSAAYTTVLADAGKHILHPSADTTARIFTIDSNANVAYPVGTAITFINQDSAGVLTIAITTDTMRLAGTGTTGSRTLAANGIATAVKVTSTEWIISGVGLT